MIKKEHRIWILVCFGLITLFLSSQGFRGYWSKRSYYKKLSKDLEDLRKMNKELEQELERIKKDPTRYGDYARRELGLGLPGEMEYRFISPDNSKRNK